jgi:hypothetical protein
MPMVNVRVIEGGLEHSNAGDFPESGNSCRQDTAPLGGRVNGFPETARRDIRANTAARSVADRPPEAALVTRPCRVAQLRLGCGCNVPGGQGTRHVP